MDILGLNLKNSTNSLDWWQCINNINPNVIIPQYILDQNQGNDIGDNTVNNNNYSSMSSVIVHDHYHDYKHDNYDPYDYNKYYNRDCCD